MDIHHSTLISTLRHIAENPNRGWEGPYDAIREPVQFSEIWQRKKDLRKRIKQIDINRARLRSKTFILKQMTRWQKEVERTKNDRPALKFPGDPDRLAGKADRRICPKCKTLFYSMGKLGTTCFRCCLEGSRQTMGGTTVTSLWWHKNVWGMQGIVDFLRNEMLLWWWNNVSDHLCYQALIITFDLTDTISRLSLSTVIKERNKCYTAVFDTNRNGMVGLWSSNSCATDVSKHKKTLDVNPREVAYVVNKKMEMIPGIWF